VQAAVERFGRLDILVVASGINKVSKIVDQPAADFLEVIDANVTQSWLMARAAGRQMIKQGDGGKVILMSSARGLLGHPAGYSAYCASKSASTASPRRSAASGGRPASPSMRWARRCFARR
jgi:NAD(P)-dependent dehydrogenase (short-subunit alcohol dehydrogenase family)